MSSKAAGALGAGALVALACTAPVLAHHSTAAYYNNDQTVTIEAEIVEWSYSNPHAVLVFKDQEGGFWVGEMGNIFSMQGQGVTPDTLPVGMTIEIVGSKSRNGNNRVLVREIKREGETVYGSPD